MLSVAQRDCLALEGKTEAAEKRRKMFHADFMDPTKDRTRLMQRIEQRK